MKILKHLKLILIHKYYVFYYCCKAGIPFQGIVHDLSKFSPTEFIESVKFYTGTHSPIDEAKKQQGYSMAWLHHRGRNKHHYEYWVDHLDKGGIPIQIPFKYSLEMMCDFLGAAKAYMKKDFSYEKELEWWKKKKETNPKIHPQTLRFLDIMFLKLHVENSDKCLNKSISYKIYRTAEKEVEDERK